ncbi:NAD(P)-dependent oxidoreductase [Desulfosarcina alkanivorans]|uniref:NAD(P)-dependent oxidoreductase n=1 Tax=Desulfosarcina alkanivorans TaxID=571177 RepID=A0A5K7YR47_9BACT|nr:SDR family oxidoreductase [Desulfosarcina alkanivorans]BBO70379.1 NAD(P)-dependent oxidoreductase [Desulfosarcina alkanivorans]
MKPDANSQAMAESSQPVLVTGATGYVGGRLVPLLLAAGYRVRACARDPRRLEKRPWSGHPNVETVAMDALDLGAVTEAVTGCGVVFYLIHSMIAGKGGFADADRTAALNMAAVASARGVRRIIYLGGLGDTDHPDLSRHLRSRHEVEEIFRDGAVPVTCLRAAMILGSGSASFEMLRYLADRLPVMVTPRWVNTPCQPISISNVLEYLKRCLEVPETTGGTFDIGGPEVLTYRQLIHVYTEAAGLMPRIIFPVPVLTPRLSSLWIHLVTPVPSVIARPLAEGLSIPVVCRDKRIQAVAPVDLQDCRETMRIALNREPQAGQDACDLPPDTLPPPEWEACGDADYAGGTTLTMGFRIALTAEIEAVWQVVEAIGGKKGYYGNRWLWMARGALDAFIGGPGLKKKRKPGDRLRPDETFHFWRVAEVTPPRRLVLESKMKAPGGALMVFQLTSRSDHTELVLQSLFLSRGLFGMGYWYGLYPAHQWVFRKMLKGIARQCRARVLIGPEMVTAGE